MNNQTEYDIITNWDTAQEGDIVVVNDRKFEVNKGKCIIVGDIGYDVCGHFYAGLGAILKRPKPKPVYDLTFDQVINAAFEGKVIEHQEPDP